MTKEEFLAELEAGPYAWPGGYPKYFLAADGGAISFEAAQENKDLILAECSNLDPRTWDGWKVIGVDINWEDEDLHCAHTGKPIPSAYGSDEE